MAIQASYEAVLTQDITSTATGALTFTVSPALTNADGVLKVSIGTDREEWFEVTGVNTGNSTITTGTRGLSLTATATLTEVAANRLQHFAGEKIAIVTFPNLLHSQNTDTGTSNSTFEVNSGGNSATLDTSGLSSDNTYTFLDRTGQLADVQYVTDTLVGIGAGDVVGPSSATDNAIVRFDSTTGKIIQNSGVTLSDNDTLTISNASVGFDIDTTLTSGDKNTIDCNSMTTGSALRISSSSSSSGDWDILKLSISDTGATGAHPTRLQNLAKVSTNFTRIMNVANSGLAGNTIWLSDGTTPNGNLSGTQGDLCLNGPSGQAFYCTGTTNWTGM